MAGLTYSTQAYDMIGSIDYDDAIASANTVGVAEAQTNLEGDLNVLRTLMKDLLGVTNWYDAPSISLGDMAGKFFILDYHAAALTNVTIAAGNSTNAFDTAIKAITGHANGAGNSTTEGVILSSTKSYQLDVRDNATQNPFDDGNGNQVYGRLTWATTEYVVNWFSMVAGTETAYAFAGSEDVDVSQVLVSKEFANLPWDRFSDASFHDLSGIVGAITDDDVAVAGLLYLLSSATNQAQVNIIVDKLGHADTVAEGLSLIAINNTGGWFTGDDGQEAIDEIATLLGSTSSTSYAFAEENVLADNDTVFPALNKLDLKWGDLASVANGEGASLVGFEDSAGNTTETTVEGAMAELYTLVGTGTEPSTEYYEAPSHISPGTVITIPNSATYTPGSGDMWWIVNGKKMRAGVDYLETSATTITTQRHLRNGADTEFIFFP